jgi:hypothetical protein
LPKELERHTRQIRAEGFIDCSEKPDGTLLRMMNKYFEPAMAQSMVTF